MMNRSPFGRPFIPGGKAPPPRRGAIESSGGLDGVYAAMASEANPVPQDWFDDPSKLPKKPPNR